ncbi:MAG: protein-L-isoaspartate(D-aspartate) O-methyltransferase [Planctomycetota bacterium]|nr:MAG: protein-L-isoaspartate(D-aspartate) O-methyltransferase [Planctomycetota bacterium]
MSNSTRWLIASLFFAAAAAASADLAAQEANQPDAIGVQQEREEMVAREIEAAGVANSRVLAAMRATPRHEFVPAGFRQWAYHDAALPIGDQQTISPPFIVAFMTQAIDPQPQDRVLEIGTGSGYQAAVLSPLVKEVYTIEIVERLGHRAKQTLQRLGYKNVSVRIGDGFAGWPEEAPFDKIIVTCSPEHIPQPLVDQLREGGQMIIPVGQRYQQTLYRITKRAGELVREPLEATLFVPMTGTAEQQRRVKPDPLHPAVVNGGFEDLVGDTRLPAGWHYVRQAVVVAADAAAPGGKRYMSFANDQPGLSSQALQGFAVDGRRISRLSVSCSVAGERLAGNVETAGAPAVIISFFDERRAAIDHGQLGPLTGSFSWQKRSAEIPVPLEAREAILAVGLHGGTGRLDIDELAIRPVAEP